MEEKLLKIIGAPHGCFFDAQGSALPHALENRDFKGNVGSFYARINDSEQWSIGRLCAVIFDNVELASAAYAKTISVNDTIYNTSIWVPKKPWVEISGIGDQCTVNLKESDDGKVYVNALIQVNSMIVQVLFPTKEDFRKYLIRLTRLLLAYSQSHGDWESMAFDSEEDKRILEDLNNAEAEKIKIKQEAEAKRIKIEQEAEAKRIEEEAKRIEEYFKEKERESARQEEERLRFYQSTEISVNKHLRTLQAKRKQGVRSDDYGNVFSEKWISDIRYFLKHVVSSMTPIPTWFESEDISNIIIYIDKLVIDLSASHPDPFAISDHLVDAMTPTEFEHFCADILRKSGWEASVTQASGDQGIDVVATRNEIKLVLQCKKYSQAVGNTAVQEVIAGKLFYLADIAAVVTNAGYTSSANHLANTVGISLLHYSQLASFAERLFET
jgi:restriction system protein